MGPGNFMNLHFLDSESYSQQVSIWITKRGIGQRKSFERLSWITGGRLVRMLPSFFVRSSNENILESGWPITATCAGCYDELPKQPPDASGKPVPGFNVKILTEDGKREAKPGELGRITVK